MKQLIIFRGLPGAGKTDLAESLCDIVFSDDDYWTDENGVYRWDEETTQEALNYCYESAEQAIKNTVDTIGITSPFLTENTFEPLKKIAAEYGYRFVSLVVENRHGNKSIHNVPDEHAESMRSAFALSL